MLWCPSLSVQTNPRDNCEHSADILKGCLQQFNEWHPPKKKTKKKKKKKKKKKNIRMILLAAWVQNQRFTSYIYHSLMPQFLDPACEPWSVMDMVLWHDHLQRD